MDYGLHDFLGNLGVLAVLVTYLLLQMEKMVPNSIAYSLINAIGAVLILYSLIYDFNLSAVIIEFAWLVISVYGIWRTVQARKLAA